jgi:polyribonucleotide nucleotidyltransferase
MREITHTFTIAGKEVKISTGKIAVQSQGSILLQVGGTSVLAEANADKGSAEQDFFPLSVEYIEKMYARGAISGSRFQKREGFPSEEAIIKARQVDHSIRSLFPKSFKNPTAVVLTVLSYDEENDPETLAVLGASLALMQSGLPFYGPCASVIACVDSNNHIVINPKAEEREQYEAEMVVSAVDGKILNLEGWGKEIAEDVMDELLDKSLEAIEEMNKAQNEFIEKAGKSEVDYGEQTDYPVSEELIKEIKTKFGEKIEKAVFMQEKQERGVAMSKVKEEISESYEENEEVSSFEVSEATEYIARKFLREAIMKNDKRVSGRKLEQIRELSADIDILPTVHGSALFSRGLTQSLSIVTLASKGAALLIDDMEGESSKGFMHHYNMPGYANGEAGRFRYRPGRREIGHGAIGENALKNMIPSDEEFPYTIRVVSEITSSNGSTSMAAACAGSLALMAAGVPMKEHVAGIGVGLVTEDGNEDNYKLILDIEGIEDFYGDMDFKVCGTKNGITAIQYENKLRGVKPHILKEAFRLAERGREQVIKVMENTIEKSRDELAENAPIVETIKIETDQIGELIGPGGANIKGIVEDSEEYATVGADINIDDFGNVLITSANKAQHEFVLNTIKQMFKRAEVGEIYKAEVEQIESYGFFGKVLNSRISGLCHISEIVDAFIKDVKQILSVGDIVNVKVIKVAPDGKISFSMKGVDQPEEIAAKISEFKKSSNK